MPTGQLVMSLGVVVAVLSLAVGCSGKSGGSGSGAKAADATTTTLPPVEFKVSPADGATAVRLDDRVGVTTSQGSISAVTLLADTPGALPVPGVLTTTKDGWLSIGGLSARTTYHLKIEASGADHKTVTHTTSFTTLTPTSELHTSLNVGEGRTYGVGMPVIVVLNHTIPTAQRAALEQRLTMTTTPGLFGAWRWFNSKELHWRPAGYWPAGSKASLKIDLAGFDAGNGIWGVDGRTVNFGIGDAHVSRVDAQSHEMTVTNNGAVVRTIPVSTGRDKYPTKSGIHVINEKAAQITMDSATVGIPRNSPDGYYETVNWDVRISNSGEFVHAAPWSVGAQGNSNVSHGCVNMSDPEAHWFYDFSRAGDVVEVVGTPEKLAPDNGYGDYQIPWANWAN